MDSKETVAWGSNTWGVCTGQEENVGLDRRVCEDLLLRILLSPFLSLFHTCVSACLCFRPKVPPVVVGRRVTPGSLCSDGYIVYVQRARGQVDPYVRHFDFI